MTFSSYCVLLTLFLCIASASAIDIFVSSNEFTLENQSTFSVLNTHRAHEPVLRFTILGSTINTRQIEQLNATTRRFKLADRSAMHFSTIQKSSNVTEYYLIWHGGGPNENREVCFHYGENGAYWYNSYQDPNPSWPMNANRNLTKQYFNYLHDWRTSKEEFAHILEHFYLNSDGFAVILDQQQPLFMRKATNSGDHLLCFSVDRAEPYMTTNHDPTYLDLKIHIFASTNIRNVLDYVVHSSGFIPKPTEIPDIHLFAEPYWQLWATSDEPKTTENRILEFINKAKEADLELGQIQIDSFWKKEDFSISIANLPNFDEKLQHIHDRGFQLVAPIIPDIYRNSRQTNAYFIRDANGQKVHFVDFSNPQACKWFESVLRMLHYDAGIDSYFLDSKTFAPGFQLHDACAQRYPNELITKYIETASQIGNNTAKVAFKTQHLPIFLQLSGNIIEKSGEELVRSLIAAVLPVSIAGYSYVIPHKIGLSSRELTEELYIRWIQATALMPRMFFHVPPWEMSIDSVKIAKKFIDLHARYAGVFVELAKKRVATGSPIIQPMWYGAPDDRRTYRIDDQFMLGDKIIVAPVLIQGMTARNVYFPAGIWYDQYGQSYTGPGDWTLAAPLDTLLYFKKN